MKKLGKLNLNAEKMLSYEEMVGIRGGVTREEYCEQNCEISQYCWENGDSECHYNAGVAWFEYCEPYGMNC